MSNRIMRRKIGASHHPFIVAEMSGNHNQSLERALKIVGPAAFFIKSDNPEPNFIFVSLSYDHFPLPNDFGMSLSDRTNCS